jgi:drug/metabolite transporter (DMT)-like permease
MPEAASPAGSATTGTHALAALALGAMAMGASPILVRLADVGPFASAFWRVLLALPLLWAWDRWENRAGSGAPAPFWSRTALLAGALFAGDLFFWHLAITHTTVANATFFATTAPIWVVLGAWLMRSETISRHTLAGLALALCGGALLVGESLDVAPGRVVGDVYGITTAVFFGGYFLAVRAARGAQGPARITFVATLVTSALLFVVALALEPTILPHSAQGVLALVALAVVSHAGGQGLLSYALGHLPATFSSLVIFLEAIAAAILAWIILGEAVSPVQAAGGAVILASVWIARPRPAKTPAA